MLARFPRLSSIVRDNLRLFPGTHIHEMIEGSIDKQDKKYNENLIYARNRLIAGAGIGFLVTMITGYFWACYQHNISMKIGFNIFWYPIVGLGLTVMSFFGAVVGAIASLFTKKWKKKNL